jgi:hypothetical protein
MSIRRLPVRPDLDQLKHQARELLRAFHEGDPAAIAELRELHPDPIDPARARLVDAQLVLARSYQAASWTRLTQAVRLARAIWANDLAQVRELVTANPRLIDEPVLIRTDSNWGPPLTYAANLGHDQIIRFLRSRGATDLESAAGRAALQGKVATARMLYEMAGRPPLETDALGGPAYGGQAPDPRAVRPPRAGAARHTGHGAPPGAHRSAGAPSRARSRSAHPNLHPS